MTATSKYSAARRMQLEIDQKSKVMKCREKERRPLGGNIRGNCVGAPRLRSFVSTGNTGSYG